MMISAGICHIIKKLKKVILKLWLLSQFSLKAKFITLNELLANIFFKIFNEKTKLIYFLVEKCFTDRKDIKINVIFSLFSVLSKILLNSHVYCSTDFWPQKQNILCFYLFKRINRQLNLIKTSICCRCFLKQFW